ncbi:MAG: hypothetical protein N3B16_10795 [Candidatus Aminicenantes bacterium]|nr:hypothetical protein [Candidatus Aminicenantes bacterium]
MIRSLIREIEKVPDPITRSDYLRLLSERFNVDEKIIRSLTQDKVEEEKRTDGSFELLAAEKRLLQILDQSTQLARQILAEIKPEEVSSWPGAPIFLYLLNNPDCPSNLLSSMKAFLPTSLYQQLARILIERPVGGTKAEALDCLRTLRRYRLEKEIFEIQRKISDLERQGQREKLRSLLLTKQRLMEEIIALK